MTSDMAYGLSIVFVVILSSALLAPILVWILPDRSRDHQISSST